MAGQAPNGHTAGTKAQEAIMTAMARSRIMGVSWMFALGAGDGNRTRTISLGS